jgi:hypothetical protein
VCEMPRDAAETVNCEQNRRVAAGKRMNDEGHSSLKVLAQTQAQKQMEKKTDPRKRCGFYMFVYHVSGFFLAFVTKTPTTTEGFVFGFERARPSPRCFLTRKEASLSLLLHEELWSCSPSRYSPRCGEKDPAWCR